MFERRPSARRQGRVHYADRALGCGRAPAQHHRGLREASVGGVILEGKEVTMPGLDRMVVFQSFALMPWLSAFNNVRLAVSAAHLHGIRHSTGRHLELYRYDGAQRRGG